MNLIDAPVTAFKDDRFGHAKLAHALADYIADSRSDSGSIIAVAGSWGSGKSGILNLLIQVFQDRSLRDVASAKSGISPIFVRFEPWLVGSRDVLIAALFGQLANAIGKIRESDLPLTKADRRRFRIAVEHFRQKLMKFCELASIASAAAAPFDASGGAAVASLLTGAGGGLLKKMVAGERSLEEDRKELVEALTAVVELRPRLRFVMLIDDMDRLEPNEVVEVIRLVKAVAALPYVTYVLAFDKMIVEKAIEVALSVDSGARFLEKIVQFVLPVPALQSRHLPDLLEQYFRERFPEDADYSSRRALFVFRVWGGRLLKTPRDAKRLLSAVSSIWPSLKGRADLLDLAWIEMLKLRASSGDRDLYSWVRNYMMSVEHISFDGTVVGTKDDADSLARILNHLGWYRVEEKGSNLDIHHLGAFLPGIHPDYLEEAKPPRIFQFPNGHGDWRSFAVERRLGSPRHWRYYFGFSAPESAVSSDTISDIMKSARRGSAELVSLLERVTSSRDPEQLHPTDQLLFENLEPGIEGLIDIEASAWLQAIATAGKALDDHSASTFTPDRSNFKIRSQRLVAALFRRLSPDGRLSLFRDVVRIPTSHWVLATFMRRQKHLHINQNSRPTDFESESVFDSEQLKIAGREMSHAFAGAKWEQFILHKDAWGILFSWLDFDPRSSSAWLKAQLAGTEDQLVARLEDLVTYSYSDKATPHLPAHYIDYFVPIDGIRTRLSEIRQSGSHNADKARHLLSIWQSSSPGPGSRAPRSAMERELFNWEWRFVFNPAAYDESKGTVGWKRVTFEDGGRIAEGRNNNEDSWRAAGELLEFLDDKGEVYSRFRFDADARRFDHTNDVDTKSIKSQYMTAAGVSSGS